MIQPQLETLSVLIRFFPFYIGDGQIASSMAVYHSNIFLLLDFF